MLHVKSRHTVVVAIAVSFTTILFFQNCGKFKTTESMDQLSASSTTEPPPLNQPAGSEATVPSGIISSVTGVLSFSNKSAETVIVEFDKIYLQSDLTIQCKKDSVIVNCNITNFQNDSVKQRSQAIISVPNSTEGLQEFEVSARHSAGTTGGYKVSWTFDKTPPSISLTPLFDINAQVTAASFSYLVSDLAQISQVHCLLDRNIYAPCSSPVNLPALAGGTHYFEVKAVDLAGNASTREMSWMATVTPSNTQIVLTGKPAGITESTDATFTFTKTPNIIKLTCKLDSQPATECNGTYVASNLSSAVHKLTITGYDIANAQIAQIFHEWKVEILHRVDMANNAVLGVFGTGSNNTKLNYRFIAPTTMSGNSFKWTVNGGAFMTAVPYIQLIPKDIVGSNDFSELCVESGDKKVCSKLVLNRFTFSTPLIYDGANTGYTVDLSKVQALGKGFARDNNYLYSYKSRLPVLASDVVKILSEQYVVVNTDVYFYSGTAFSKVPNLSADSTRVLTLQNMLPEVSSCNLVADANFLYYGDKLIDKIVAAEAQLLPLAKFNSCKFPLLRDSKNVVFCKTCQTGQYTESVTSSQFYIVANADPSTFQAVADSANYYKDVNRVYFSSAGTLTEVAGALPASFKLSDPTSEFYTNDSQKVYYMANAVAGANGSDVTIKNMRVLLSNGSVFNNGVKVDGMNASDFKLALITYPNYQVTYATSNNSLFQLPNTGGLSTSTAAFSLAGVQASTLKLVLSNAANGLVITDGINVWHVANYIFASGTANPFTLLGAGDETNVKYVGYVFLFKDSYYSSSGQNLMNFKIDDVASFRSINQGFYATNTSVYGIYAGKLTGADPVNFTALSTGIGKDLKNVYTLSNASPIAGADAPTFTVLNIEFSKDKNVGYYGSSAITGSIGASFQVFANADSYAKDANNVYYRNKIITGADVATFEPTSSIRASDKNYCYFTSQPSAIPPSGVCPQ